MGATPSTWNFGSNWPRWSEIADFRSIFGGSASAVTSSEKIQLTLIGGPLHSFQWGQDEHRTLSLSSQRVAQKRSVQNLNKISCDNSEKVRDRMLVRLTILITKSHMGYRLITTSMTLNGVIAIILRFFAEFDCFVGQLRHSGWRQMSVKYCLPVTVFHFWPWLTHLADNEHF